jgi:uncharacterized membrane protein HdeD (DUF308 family)
MREGLLLAITLVLAGVMLIAFSTGDVPLTAAVGVVLVGDGAYYAIGGLPKGADSYSKRYHSVWGSLVALVGLALIFSSYPILAASAPEVLGVLLIAIGIVALWHETTKKPHEPTSTSL